MEMLYIVISSSKSGVLSINAEAAKMVIQSKKQQEIVHFAHVQAFGYDKCCSLDMFI